MRYQDKFGSNMLIKSKVDRILEMKKRLHIWVFLIPKNDNF